MTYTYKTYEWDVNFKEDFRVDGNVVLKLTLNKLSLRLGLL
jgi:hypothetical protein